MLAGCIAKRFTAGCDRGGLLIESWFDEFWGFEGDKGFAVFGGLRFS